MKNICESAEVFEAYAIIDCCRYMIKDILKNLYKSRSPIEAMIDEVSGYDDAQTEKAKLLTIDLLEQIIEAKKTIEADYTEDTNILEELKGSEFLPDVQEATQLKIQE